MFEELRSMNAVYPPNRLLTTACCVGLCFGAIGCSKPAADASNADARAKGGQQSTTSSSDRPERKAAVIKAVEFAEEYAKDKQAARQKYQGKVVDLSGRIDRLNRNISRQAFVVLEGGRDGVRCLTVDKAPWNKVTPGQQITLRGTVADDSSPMLFSCEIIETGESPALTITAEQLARETAADQEATYKKYKEKPLIVTGEVVELKPAKGDEYLDLKGDDKRRVHCVFPLQGDMLEGLKVGQQVKVLGQYSMTSNKSVDLILCFVIRDK
jgi:hypothetical protein